ncbi:MAG: contractile injection system tape measure protein, partial [Bacteroidota bacterium]
KKGIENIEQRLRTSETVSAAWFDALKPQLQQLIRYMETLPPETAYDYKKGIEDVKRWLGKTTPNEETVTALEATLHIALEAVSRLQENSSDTEKSVAIVRSVQNELKQWLHSTEQRPHASETVSAARFDALKARLHQLTQHLETLAPETAYDYKKGIEDIARQLAEIRPQVQDVNALHVQENTQKRWNRDKEETHIEGIYLQNAGMVILWSFFKPLFEALKFTENHKFIDEAQQHRAVHVLQYLAGEKEYCSEHELGLNKLLCGLELNTPIPKEVQLLEEEKERVNDLIQSAIGYWPAIKNTSVAGFREAFLLREGKLSRNGNDWQLQVVQKGYDVMMKTLPWGISLVKLPWMPGILYVEWPY